MFYLEYIISWQVNGKLNYTTTIDFAKDVKKAIDDYWKLTLSKEQMVERVAAWFEKAENRGLALRGATFSTSFAKVLGKKRLSTLKETLKTIDADLYNELD